MAILGFSEPHRLAVEKNLLVKQKVCAKGLAKAKAASSVSLSAEELALANERAAAAMAELLAEEDRAKTVQPQMAQGRKGRGKATSS